MRDLFAQWATRATGATQVESASNHSGSGETAAVAQASAVRATRATNTPTIDNSVAHVAYGQRGRATSAENEKVNKRKDFPDMLPVLPMLPTEDSKAARCTPPDCLMLLDEMHSGIRAVYVPGALALLDTETDLRQRFDATEARIDGLAKMPGGPSEYDFCRALADHAAVWRELIARHRARQETVADPMPALPENTAVAIGISYGDEEPGTWDVIRVCRR